jgi:hypothetical protein
MKNKKFILLSFIVVLAIFIFNKDITINAEDNDIHLDSEETENISNIDNGIYDSYTDTDSPNGININKYIELSYAKNVTLDNGLHNKVSIIDDDDIVKIIPRELGSNFLV